MITEDLVLAVTQNAGVNELMADRLYAGFLPQDPTYPAACYEVVTGERQQAIKGPSDLKNSRVQISSYAPTWAAARALNEAIRLAVEAATTFQKWQITEFDQYDHEAKACCVIQEFSLWRNDPAGSP